MLSFVFHNANLQLPLIAAGDNLSFFPLGPVFRRGGAFFIRRSLRRRPPLRRGRRRLHPPPHPRGLRHRVLPRRRPLAHGQAPAAQARAAQHGGRGGAQRAQQGGLLRPGVHRLRPPRRRERVRPRAHRRREAKGETRAACSRRRACSGAATGGSTFSSARSLAFSDRCDAPTVERPGVNGRSTRTALPRP